MNYTTRDDGKLCHDSEVESVQENVQHWAVDFTIDTPLLHYFKDSPSNK